MKIRPAFNVCMFCLTASAINAQSKTNTVTYANTSLSNLVSPTSINQSLLVDKDRAHNIGSITKGWKNLFLDTAIYIDSTRFIAFRTGSGDGNTAIGKDILHSDISGSSNTGVGYRCLYYNTSGYENTAVGRGVLYKNTTGRDNTAIGYQALYFNTTGGSNTANGDQALYNNTTGSVNTAHGEAALYYNTSGLQNAANGSQALFSNTTGSYNTAAGTLALYSNINGNENTADGNASLYYNANGSENSAFGEEAYFKGTGLSNTSCFGYRSGGVNNVSNRIEIGNTSVSWIGGEVGWSTYSDARIKNNIKENVPGLVFINKLRPVTYHYNVHQANSLVRKDNKREDWTGKYDLEKIQMIGFIAQEVEKTAKDINYDFSGVDKPADTSGLYSLRYSDFVVPLVKAVQELSKQNDVKDSIIAIQNNKINNLESRLAKIEVLMNANQSTLNSQLPTAVSSASLQQNIPNPFSSSTTINYSLPKQFSSARIIITDKNGSTLKQFNLSNNKGSVNVDAGTLTSGAYQYTLFADGKIIATKQMVLTK